MVQPVSPQTGGPKVNPTRRWLNVLIAILLLMPIGCLTLASVVGWGLTHPSRESHNLTPQAVGLNYEEVSFPSRGDNLSLKGWFLPVSNSNKTVIFAHGYSKNRLQSDVPALSVAKALVDHGYNVLLFDFRNCGLSEGKVTSVGQFEKLDLLGAIDYAKSRHLEGEKLAILGFSMGAATGALAAAEAPEVQAVILDSPFADLTTYLEDNLPVWSHLPAFPFNSLILNIIPPLTGTAPAQVSPEGVINQISPRPILFIHGDGDTKIPMQNSLTLLRASGNPKNELWVVPGADHVKSYSVAPEEYLLRVTRFLDTHL